MLSKFISYLLFSFAMLAISQGGYATVYTVSTKTDLQNRMSAALPGDTVIVLDNTYNFGSISFTNNNGNASGASIVLKAQSVGGVIFSGSTYLSFKGNNIVIDGFTFKNGNSGTSAVIRFGTSSSNVSNDSRITNITIDNYNSAIDVENEWVGIYGVRNRVDHCTFINKSNPRATIVVWYSSVTYPAEAISTYHRIDSNYFKGRSYMGSNGGETIRVGDSNGSRTNGFNTVEFNLFEDCTQAEPEIISNKSDFNTYRYNTFRNCDGGLTLRHGRYCLVYGNFFIRDNAMTTAAYGIRIIDKGHKVFNNYFEGMNANGGGTSQNRAVISLFNGLSTDTTNAAAASGYFPADSVLVAFNTIVDCRGGGGIVLGNTNGGTIEPKGIVLANNLIKMNAGTALYSNPANTSYTFVSEGNIYQAPSGLGIATTGWQAQTLNFGARTNGILQPPSVVSNAAVNSSLYAAVFSDKDVKLRTRSAVFDTGCEELDGTGTVMNQPLQSWQVGAGSSGVTLPVQLLQFKASAWGKNIQLSWTVTNESQLKFYELQYSTGGEIFSTLATLQARNLTAVQQYSFLHEGLGNSGNFFYRLKMIDDDGRYRHSFIIKQAVKTLVTLSPNPAQGQIIISLPVAMNRVDVEIVDVINRRIKIINNITSNMPLPVNDLVKGWYYLKIYNKGQLISTEKLLKQ